MATNDIWKYRETEKTITDLRAEVAALKQCVTQHTFQAIVFSGIIWGIVFKMNMPRMAYYLCGSIIVFVLLVVVRTANHKYSTINRILGYELHLCRLKDYSLLGEEKRSQKWSQMMLEVGWEEAMCAWRFVQPTFFEYLYESTSLFLPKMFLPHRRIMRPEQTSSAAENKQSSSAAANEQAPSAAENYEWFDTRDLMGQKGKYHPGNYLRNIHLFLYTVAVFSIIIMCACLFYQVQSFVVANPGAILLKDPKLIAAGATVLVTVLFFVSQVSRQTSFRTILENELLSIQSCAVVWRLVITCHLVGSAWALKKNRSYRYYTKYTAGLAVEFSEHHFYDPHVWLADWERIYGTEVMDERLKAFFPKGDTAFIANPGKRQ